MTGIQITAITNNIDPYFDECYHWENKYGYYVGKYSTKLLNKIINTCRDKLIEEKPNKHYINLRFLASPQII